MAQSEELRKLKKRERYAKNAASERAKARERSRKAYAENKELVLQRNKKWQQENPEAVRKAKQRHLSKKLEEDPDYEKKRAKTWRALNPEKAKEATLRWQVANPDNARSRSAKYYRHNRMLCLNRKKAWYSKNKDKARAQSQRRRARLRDGVSPGVSAEFFQSLCDKHQGACWYCGKRDKLQREHVVPISRGGRDEPSNVVPACAKCNASKRSKLVHEWLKDPPEWYKTEA